MHVSTKFDIELRACNCRYNEAVAKAEAAKARGLLLDAAHAFEDAAKWAGLSYDYLRQCEKAYEEELRNQEGGESSGQGGGESSGQGGGESSGQDDDKALVLAMCRIILASSSVQMATMTRDEETTKRAVDNLNTAQALLANLMRDMA